MAASLLLSYLLNPMVEIHDRESDALHKVGHAGRQEVMSRLLQYGMHSPWTRDDRDRVSGRGSLSEA